METCSRAGIMSLWNLALCPKILCCSIFRVLSRLLGLSPTLLKKSWQDGNVQTATHTLPELSQDILMDIFSTLEIPDLVRAGAVCSSWHSAYAALRNLGKYKLSQTPCLLYTSESAGESVACLYSLVEKRTYRLTLPEPAICSRYLLGSSHGWLFTVDDRSEMHLVNPITGEQIALPSVITLEHVNPIFNKFGAVEKYKYSRHIATRVVGPQSVYALCELREVLQYKAILFPETSKGSYIVVLIHNPEHQLSFARVGDEKWTWLPPHTNYEDCIYKDGLLYAITVVGEIHAYDLSGPVITMKIVMGMAERLNWDNFDNMYIVEAPWGDLLNVWRTADDDGDIDEPATLVRNTTEIKIDKVDTIEKALVEFKCLHNHVLFLGHNSLCLSTKEYPHLKANHAYFTDNHPLWTKGYKNNRRDIGILDLENNSREELVCHALWSNWPTPVWITPSLGRMKMKSALNKQL